MSHRGPRMTEFEERDYYPHPRRSAPDLDEPEYRTARVATRSPPPPSRSRVTTRDDEIDLRLREREANRTPAFLRDDARRTEAGPMVLRKRDVETIDRHRRSPSPVRYRELVRRPKSASPPPMREEHERLRFVERERERVRSPSVVRRRTPSPTPPPVRFVERPRWRSPSPAPTHEHIRTRIVDKERAPSPSPSPPPPPPPPPVIRGPTVEREVITHYMDIDHGSCTRLRQYAPSPSPRPLTGVHRSHASKAPKPAARPALAHKGARDGH